MRPSDVFRFSTQNINRARLRTLLSSVGIAIGTATLIILVSAGFGFQSIAVGQAADINALTQIAVFPVDPATNQPHLVTPETVAAIRAIPHVRQVDTSISMPLVRASVGGTSAVLPAVGGAPLDAGGPYVKSGDLAAADAVVVPRSLLDKAGLSSGRAIGQPVTITVGSSVCCAAPRSSSIEVAGSDRTYSGRVEAVTNDVPTFRGGPALPSQVGLTQPLATTILDEVFGLGPDGYLAAHGFTEVKVSSDDVRFTNGVEQRLKQLGFQTISNTDSIARSQFIFSLMDAVLFGLGLIALGVASVGIANTMIMTVVERTREIGVLKALGAAPATVRSLFLVEAALTGLIGALSGLALASLVAVSGNVAFQHWLDTTQVVTQGRYLVSATLFQVGPGLDAAAIAVAVAISVVAGVFPSQRAVALEPVEALRHE